MKPLKVWFGRLDDLVLMKVLEQDNALRNNLNATYCGFTIKSTNIPDISPSLCEIYIRGNMRGCDDQVVVHKFEDSIQAKQFVTAACRAIAELNKQYSKVPSLSHLLIKEIIAE